MKTQSPNHPDFTEPWMQSLLSGPTTTILEVPTRNPDTPSPDVTNSMFAATLYTPSAIRAQINFTRPTREPTAIIPTEYCYLLSLGDGLDGKRGRAHGGFNALVLDQILGSVAAKVSGAAAPATATMTVDYRAPIPTPGVVLVRGWVVERSGRKTWGRARIEDGEGKVLAEGKALFVDPRPGVGKL